MNSYDPQKIVQQLNDIAGRTLVALIASIRLRDTVDAWVDGDAIPTPKQLERMSVALELLQLVTEHENENIARAWLIGENTILADGTETSPALAIRDSAFDAVRASANRLITNTWS